MASTALDLLTFVSALLILGGLVGFAIARYWARHVEFATQREHHITRAEIDRVLRCVEPEEPREIVVRGLIPPQSG